VRGESRRRGRRRGPALCRALKTRALPTSKVTKEYLVLPIFAYMSAAAAGLAGDDDASAQGPQLLCLSLNQDQTCLACGTDSGFVIYDIEPFQQRCFRKDVPLQGQLVPMGPLRIVTMLFRSNIFALVGTAANQSFPPNKVAIWDDMENGGKTIGVVTCSSEVKSVLLRRDKVSH
jgi:hypothetical protein